MRFHFWHTFMSLFFAALVLFGIGWLNATGRLTTWVPIWDFVLMALATQRMTRLFTYDLITRFIRDWFAGHDDRSFLGTLGALINCPWCTGLWFAFLVVFFYFAVPLAWYIILMLAIASVGSFFQLVANWVGWSAEAKKRECQSIALPR